MYHALQGTSNDKLVLDINNAINGEFNAIRFYEHLAQLAPNEEVRNRILEIRNDEIRHYQGFTYTYTWLTGQQPSPQLTEPLPYDFKSGILTAFKDEQEAVDFYHRVSRESNMPYISNQFRSNASDEQNHAVWFLFFINKY
ncbi:ferritin-like domain-containing protein [Solibacillus daqui]|uniref:ferritin-like domain-containing protein n=1 Tax=Solibacillus daqui TaxID=2912187 RepID=UPI002365FA08|nr:ferritin-like domain-containing protein [Solibacillus daqui]